MCTRSWCVRPVDGVSWNNPEPNGATTVTAFTSPGSTTACKDPRRFTIRLRNSTGSANVPADDRARYVLDTPPEANIV